MIAMLSAVVLAPQVGQKYKYVDIDKFNTPPYSVTLSGNGYDNHDWTSLDFGQCWFYRRNSNIQVIANPNHTTLTFSLGNGGFSFESPLKIYWSHYLGYYPQNGRLVDFGSVSRVYVDLDEIPDILELYALDKDYKSYLSSWLLQPNGVYFNVGGSSIDWRHLRILQFRLDFTSSPNPLSFHVNRIYARLKPESSSPAQHVFPSGG